MILARTDTGILLEACSTARILRDNGQSIHVAGRLFEHTPTFFTPARRSFACPGGVNAAGPAMA